MASNIPADPPDSKQRVLANQRIVGRDGFSRRVCPRNQRAHSPRAVFASQTNAPFGVCDPSREKQLNRCLEVIRVFEKERTLLRKLNLEALIDRDLGIVRLDLAEVRIRGYIENELVFQYRFRIQAELSERGSLSVFGIVRIAQVELFERAKHSVGDKLQVPSGRDLFQAACVALLIQTPDDATRVLRPERLLVLARDIPRQHQPPGLRITRGKAQAAKGNRHPDHVSTIGDSARRVPDGVEGHVEVLVARPWPFRPESIGLHAQRICEKSIGMPVVIKRIQHEFDKVIVENVLATRQASAELLRLPIEADEDRVQVLGVVSEIDLGSL